MVLCRLLMFAPVKSQELCNRLVHYDHHEVGFCIYLLLFTFVVGVCVFVRVCVRVSFF